MILPAAALATPTAFALGEAPAVLLLWSAAILLGGAVEMSAYVRRSRGGATPLAAWALRAQGNLSLVVTALSALLVWQGLAWALPGLWLLLLGHSLYLMGGLAFPALPGVRPPLPGGRPAGSLAAVAAALGLRRGYRAGESVDRDRGLARVSEPLRRSLSEGPERVRRSGMPASAGGQPGRRPSGAPSARRTAGRRPGRARCSPRQAIPGVWPQKASGTTL